MAIDWNIGEVEYMNSSNYKERRPQGASGEVNLEPSMTVPGDSMTIKEIMDRALAGIKPDTRAVQFFDTNDMDRINAFPIDLTDLEGTRAELEALVTDVEEAIAERDAEPEPDPAPDPAPDPDPEPDPV